MKCAIQWIDSAGKPTPDDNDAVAMVYIVAHTEYPRMGGEPYEVPESAHHACCADHLARLSEPGMGYWVRESLPTWGQPNASAWLNALTSNAPAYSVLELYVYTTQCQATGFDNLAAERSIGWLASPAGAAMRVSHVYANVPRGGCVSPDTLASLPHDPSYVEKYFLGQLFLAGWES